MALVLPETGGVNLMAFEIDAASIGPSKITAIWLLMLTPATPGDGMRAATRRPMSTVVKLVTYAVSLVPSVSTAGSPTLIV